MQTFLEQVALGALLLIEHEAYGIYLNRRDLTPELDPDDAARAAVQRAIFRTVEMLEPNEKSSDEDWLSQLYWQEVST
jgi:hypothetical protein